MHVLPIDHRSLPVARRMHAILTLAYAQEAQLMKVERFTELDETVEEIRLSDEFVLGALEEDELVGVLSIGPDDEPGQLSISTLVVHPRHQRRGVGELLLREALRRTPGMVLSVCTGSSNLPALALYRKLGFHAYRHGTIGPEHLALVKLRNLQP